MSWFHFLKKKEKQIQEESDEQCETLRKTVEDILEEETTIEEVTISKKSSDQEIARYIEQNIQNIKYLEDQNEKLRHEYEEVTRYLRDIQIIDALPEEDQKELVRLAESIARLEEERQTCQKRSNKINEKQYQKMEQYESVMNGELAVLKKQEKLQMDIRSDMRHLEGEKSALLYEKKERVAKQSLYRGVSISASICVFSLFILLGILWYFTSYDLTIAFLAVILVGGICVLLLFNSARNNKYGSIIADKKITKAIQLLNRVKIKYVNNRGLLDYMYEKYEVKNAQELEYIWKHYLILKSDQEKLEENELEKSEMKGLLQSLLQKHDVYDTSIWIYQVEALIDNKEMVEVRHKLNANRTILRKQIAYNDNQSEEIKRILKELAEERAYARELVGKII